MRQRSQKQHFKVALIAAIFIVLTTARTVMGQEDTAEQSMSSSNYVYIEEFALAPGAVPNEAIAEAKEWVRAYRDTGEYKSVRLFLHNTGPNFAVYLILEPNSWQSIEDGQAKFFEANPEAMDRPFNWGDHSDNILGEIIVE